MIFQKTVRLALTAARLIGPAAQAFTPYHENFTAAGTTCGTAGNWCLNFPYGRNGFMLVDHRGGAQTSYLPMQQDTANFFGVAPTDGGYLFVRGMANNMDLSYNNIWTGRMARLETQYNATANQPFGFQVIRHLAVIDPSDREDNVSYHRSNIGIWLVQNNAVASENNFAAASPTGDWSTINNAISFYEMQINQDTVPGWGYFAGSDINVNSTLAAVPRTNLSGTDDIGSSVNGLIFANDDATIVHGGRQVISRQNMTGTSMLTTCGAGTSVKGYALVRTTNRNNATIGAANNTMTCGVANKREVGMRMTHDGTTVRMYLNPNPYGRTGTYEGVNYSGYRNEWYRVGAQNVSFNTNMKVMMGQEQLFFTSGLSEAVFDNFVVRPVAQSLTAQITTPAQGSDHRVMQGAAQQYEVRINPTFNAEDAGIGEIYVRKPSAAGQLFNGVNWDYSNVVVCLAPNSDQSSGAACNAGGEQRLTYAPTSNNTTDNTTLTTAQFQAYTLNSDFTLAGTNTGEVLAIRLKKTSNAENNIFRNTAAGAHVRVYFTLTAGTTTSTGNDFQLWVHNEKFHDTAQDHSLDTANGLRYATNERTRVAAAATGALTVKSYNQPAGTLVVSVSPSPLFWGDYLPFATVEVRTPTTGSGTDITRLLVTLPPEGSVAPFEFTLKDGSVVTSLIDSLRIPDGQETHDRMQVFTGAGDTINDCTIGTYYYCYYSNQANPNYRVLVVNYGNTYRIPGTSGYDRLTFFFDQAPQFNESDQIVTNWSGQVSSEGFVTGTVPQAMTAFQANPANMQTIVRAASPVTSGYVTPNILSNNINNVNPTTGVVSYFVRNQGGPSNSLKHIELLLPYETYNSVAGDPGHPFSRENFGVPVVGDFTGMKIDGGNVSPAVTVVGNENISGTDYRVVRFTFDDAAKVNSGQTFSVDVNLSYYRNTNLAAQAYAIRHRADNLNYSVAPAYPYPRYTNGSEDATASWEIQLTPPQPRGEAFVFRGADQSQSARIFSNEVVTGNISDVRMKLYNRGGIGNNIDSIEINFPPYLELTDVCSSYLGALGAAADCASDGNGNISINNTTHVITIDYNGLANALKSSQDTIAATPCTAEPNVPCDILTFTIAQDADLANPALSDAVFVITDGNSDGIFETVTATTDGQANIRTGTFYAKLNNASGATSYTRATTGRSLNATIEYPDPAMQAYVTTDLVASYEVDATEPTTTFKAYVKNTALGEGNDIYRLQVRFPTSPAIVSGVPTVLSLVRDYNGTLTAKTVTTEYTTSWDAGTQILSIEYTNGNELPPSLAPNDGTSYVDIVEIRFNDTVTTTGNQAFTIVGHSKVGGNVTGKFVTASIFDGNDGDDNYNNLNNQDMALFYKIPPALATGTVVPKIAYTTPSTFSMQSKFFVQNKAVSGSSNRIFAVRISLPAGVSVADAGAISARSGAAISCTGGNGFTGGCNGAGEALVIDYSVASPPFLDPGSDADDEILVTWSHSLAAEGSLVFSLGFDNNDGNGFNGNLEPVPASLVTVALQHEPQMKIEVIAKPGDPQNPASFVNDQTVNITVPDDGYHRFRLTVTPNANGPKIHRLRITPPAPFDAASLDTSDLLPAGTTMSAGGGFLTVNFAGNQLTAASTVLEFRLRENRSFNIPGSHPNADDVSWAVATDFFHDLFDNTSVSNLNLPGPTFAGKLTPDGQDDEIVYVPGTNFNTPRAMVPVSGSGAAGITWNQIRLLNPAPAAVMFVSPKEIFRINTGDPDYTWTQEIRVRNQSVLNNDIRLVDVTPPSGLLKSLGSVCNLSGDCDISLTGITLRKGLTASAESGYANLTAGVDFTVASVESGTATFSLSAPHSLRITLSESARLLHNETLLISFSASHGLTSTANLSWAVKAGNFDSSLATINGADPVPLGETLVSAIVSPSYTANFIVQSVNGVAGASAISAATSSNTFIFNLTNNSTGGDGLTRLRIAMPGYFNVSTATVTSQRGATVSFNSSAAHYDTSGIQGVLNAAETGAFNRANYIQLQYGTALAPEQSDTITITVADSFFPHTTLPVASRADEHGYIERSGNATEVLGDSIGNEDGVCDAGEICEGGPVSFKASAEYDTSGGAFSYISAFPAAADRISIIQPAPVANAWLASSSIPLDGTGPRNQEVSLVIRNNAAASAQGNILYRAKIKIPREINSLLLSSLSGISYRKTGETSFTAVPGSCNSVPSCSDAANGTVDDYFAYLDFTGAGGILAGEQAEVRFTIAESFSQAGFIDLEVVADNASAIDAGGKPDTLQHVSADTSMDKGTLLTTSSPSQTLRLNFIPEDPQSEGYITYSVDPVIVPSRLPTSGGTSFVMDQKDLTTMSIYCNPGSPNLTDNCDARYTVYAIGEYVDVHYRLVNGSQNFALEEAKVRLSIFDYADTAVDWSQFEITEVASARLGVISAPVIDTLDLFTSNAAIADDLAGSDGSSETKEITVNYSSLSGGGIAVGQGDTIRIRLRLRPELLSSHLTTTDAGPISYDAVGKAGGFDISRNVEFRVSAQVKRATVAGYRNVTSENQQQYFYVRRAPFARITGLLAPAEMAASLTFRLQNADGSAAALDGGGSMPSVSARQENGNTYALFVFDRVPVGSNFAVVATSADPKLEAQEYIRRKTELALEKSLFTVTANAITALSDILPGPFEVRYKQLNAALRNELTAPLDSRTRIILPANALDNNPRINIRIEETASQVWGTLDHAGRQGLSYGKFGISAANEHKVYNLVNELPSGGVLSPVIENQLKEEGTLVLGYDPDEFPAGSERRLAIYYWEMTRKQWVKIGGSVSTTDQTVTAQITYMHRTYTVLPSDGNGDGIGNVTVFPRVFTPGRSDSYYKKAADEFGGEKTFGNLKLTFELGTSSIGSKYEVGIYNMNGRLMKKWERENTTGQGSVFWDGRDEFGGLVAGGVYVYVIRIGSEKYRGTLVVAR